MRNRGSYRPELNDFSVDRKAVENNVKSFGKSGDKLNETIEAKNMSSKSRKRKSDNFEDNEEMSVKVVTIDDSDDDIEMIEIDNDCDDCCVVRPVVCQKCDLKQDLYESLTSADFYLNPRLHPAVISLELRDTNRLNCYYNVIKHNRHLFENKTVLIMGSCVGLLALFVATVSAETVIVIDKKQVVPLVKRVIDRNKNSHNIRSKIRVMDSDVEDVILPFGIQHVDVIVSDWVNHLIFHKSCVQAFIYARDKWLKRGGLIYPDSGHVYLTGIHDNIHSHVKRSYTTSSSEFLRHIEWWGPNVYGHDMTSIRNRILGQPYHSYVDRKQVVTDECLLKSYDFYTVKADDFNYKTRFQLKAKQQHYLHAFLTYFEIVFSKNVKLTQMFSTRPGSPRTCLKPTVYYLDYDKQLTLFSNNIINGEFGFDLSQDLNRFNVCIDFEFNRMGEKSESLSTSVKESVLFSSQ